ncbi:diguanylate cyclase/phosphodiesterase (GGDEF & EAL domains) with PAS/PAC sensor(s) [uncultured Coleofasciculus sp.]|jgi:two-component system cell cycle response regulator|uniref:Diguanylate cyclase/phosphodiesterase (GGDEF & EAL domains) with PAS/PAC sensor(S) n=1 Tax=uncultured Coleofasciculus sp. TaxID=1267456 RepID=A0A6J4JZ05_9CYAN|nr:diguanylate cyclase/phosphodiesterase (GGDEF & EAL domains) with PAS/PAC sensor(s) [uncultured Coleofasciculus sp.]
MDAAVLVVGNAHFLATYVNQIRNIMSGTVEASSCLDEVVSLVQEKQPAILILQATQAGSLELCAQIKQQTQLGWTYCILINSLSEKTSVGTLDDREAIAYTEALESGADAYLSMSADTADSAVPIQENRLLRAQIQAGLRGIKFYRELMQTNDVLSTMALADPLTELSNRRAMEWELPRQIQNARSYSTPLSLIMLDVDYFKSVNDNYGHQVGDRVLQLLAARLQHNLRLQDTLFRYGGEEFVIALSQTNFQEAKNVATRLKCLVSDQPFNIDGTLALQITISLGLGFLNAEDDIKGETLLRRADENLLRAKTSGRNRVFSGDH